MPPITTTMDPVPPAAPIEEAPAAPVEEAPPFDPVLVRDFFHYLLIGIQEESPESSRVTNFRETAALAFYYRLQSGMLVLVPAVYPIADAVNMFKLLKKKVSSNAEWEVPNLEHLELVANVSASLYKVGKELKKVRKMLKDLKPQQMLEGGELDLVVLCDKLVDACDQVDIVALAAREAGLAVLQVELRRDTLAAADIAETAARTVRCAAVFKNILPAKPLHGEIKRAYRSVQNGA